MLAITTSSDGDGGGDDGDGDGNGNAAAEVRQWLREGLSALPSRGVTDKRLLQTSCGGQ